MMTKVSTITPCFNMSKYVEGFLQNLSTQTHKDLEVVLDHNNPTQKEIELVEKYNETYDNITHIQVEGVDPIGISMNRCIEYSTGDYLCIWNVDDLRTPNSIEIMASTLDENPDVDFVYGNYLIVSSFGSTNGTLVDESGKEEYLTKGMILGPFFMFRKSIIERSGLFDEQLVSGADFDFALRLAFNGKGKHIPEILGYYLNEGLGASTRINSKQPLERTVIELRYGLNVLDSNLINSAMKYDIENIIVDNKKFKAMDFINPEYKYSKENYLQHGGENPDIRSSFWDQNITGVLIKHYRDYMNGKVIEYGCNHGVMVALVSEYENVNEVVGVDLNAKSIGICKEKIPQQIEDTTYKVKFLNENLTNISCQNEYFDFGFTIHTLEHIYPDDVDKVVSEMLRVIKINGHILVNIPDKESYYWEPLHVYRPSMDELNKLFVEHGCEIIESYIDERGGQVGHSKNITALYKKVK